MEGKSEKQFALLIDADNISAKYIKPILEELSGYGNVSYKRIYGDWTSTQLSAWKDELLKNSISPIQQFSYTYGKNATDSAMIIDAMDILYTGAVDGFCIASSDSDFTRLASRLRESGRMVIGMGENKTPQPFRQACDIFTTLELLLEETDEITTEVQVDDSKNVKPQNVTDRKTLEEAIIKMITENENSGKDTSLGEVGSRLVKAYPDFDVRSYGYRLLSKFLEEFPRIELVKKGNSILVQQGNREIGQEVEKFIVKRVKSLKKGIKLSQLGQEVNDRYKNFNVRDLGYSQFNRYVRNVKGVDVIEKDGQHWVTYKQESN